MSFDVDLGLGSWTFESFGCCEKNFGIHDMTIRYDEPPKIE
jgi:hypothetical protein